MLLSATHDHRFTQIGVNGASVLIKRAIAVEAPVAIEINGFGYAVLMATPNDLIDLAFGFLLTERLIDHSDHVADAELVELDAGRLLRISVAGTVAERIYERVRHRTSDSSCGLCGVENLEQAMRSLPQVPVWEGADTSVFRALMQIESCQPLGQATRAVHAAAACTRDGAVRLVREDVGRHNAFDKLIGAMLRDRMVWEGGFALLTSRCSYELVEKAALAACPMLATISAPTDLALARAQSAGLALRVLARSDNLLATGAA